MTNNTVPGFDPRFSPAFQRGYDQVVNEQLAAPATAPAAPVAAPVRVPTAVPVASAPAAPTYAAVPTYAAAPTNAAPPAPPVAVTPPSQASAVVVESSADAENLATPAATARPSMLTQLRNPFVIALGIVAVLLLGVSSAMLGWAREASIDESMVNGQADWFLIQTLMALAPILLTLGIGSIVAALVVLAVRWRP